MDKSNKGIDEFGKELDLVPEKGDLETQLRDKQIFGVYNDEDEADRAIRQLNKLGYAGSDIYLYSKDSEKTRHVTEEIQNSVNILSCSDGTDFIGESYNKGDIVLCVLKDAQRFQRQTSVEPTEGTATTVEVASKVAEAKRKS